MNSTSWRTSGLGILLIAKAVITAVAALLQGGHPDWNQLGTEITAGVGLIAARDHKASQ